jgi:glutamate racemase
MTVFKSLHPDMPIGVFDSGIGGLTVAREIMRQMPNERIVYFGDTARVPYGTRSRATIAGYARQDVAFMDKHNVKLLLVACGTVSSVMQSENIFDSSEITCYSGVIIPAADAACEATRNKRIGVIATPATIRSGCYEYEISRQRPDITVYSQACPLLVPLAENGYTAVGCQPAEFFVREYLSPLKEQGIDALILGCTHYPLFAEVMQHFMGDDVTLISSSGVTAQQTFEALKAQKALKPDTHKARIELYCTDSVQLFKENVARFVGGDIDCEISQCRL